MKKTINTIEEALIQEMENLYCSERALALGLTKLEQLISSQNLKTTVALYVDSADDKRLMIDRILSYLNHEPKVCHTNVIDEMINETLSRMRFAEDNHFQDLLLITCFQRINNYMLSTYRSCLKYAEQLGLEKAVELLEITIGWEMDLDANLSQISTKEFNVVKVDEL